MQKAQNFKALYKIALDLLARREHSTLEMSEKLTARTDCPEIIPEVVQHLQVKKLLDDNRFADSYSRSRANRGYGKLRIQSELKSRGVSEAICRTITNSADIVEIRKKKFGEILPVEFNEKARQIRYLQYKGFSFDEIKQVFNDDDDK